MNDAVADGQAEARALADRLRREERLKQFGIVLGRHARTGILHFEVYLIVRVEGADDDAARTNRARLHRLLRVDEEVQHHLLQLREDGVRRPRRSLVAIELDPLLDEPALTKLDD